MKWLLPMLLFTLPACTDYSQGPGDMQFMLHKDVPGTNIKRGDFLSVDFIHRTEDGQFLSSSYETGRPVYFEQQRPFFLGDIFTGLKLLSEGDSATFLLNFDSMQIILNVPRPAHAKGKYLSFTVKVNKVVPRLQLSDSLFKLKVDSWLASQYAN